MAYKLRNKNAATLMAKSPLYNTPPKQMVSLGAEELKAPDRAEYDDQHAYDQAVVKYDRARNYNPDKVEYNPKDPSTYSEAKLTKAHVRPNVRGAVGQMSPLRKMPGSTTDSKGRPISTQQDDPNFDKEGRRTLKPSGNNKTTTKTTTKNTNKKNLITPEGKVDMSAILPKPLQTTGPSQSEKSKFRFYEHKGVEPPKKKDKPKPTNNNKTKPKPTNTNNTKTKTKPTATQTTIDKTVASQPKPDLGVSDMVSSIKDKVSKTQATVDKAINTNYDLISSQPKSGGRVGRVRRRQQKRTANLEKRLQNRAEIQGIRQSERGKRQSMRESASQERKNLMTDMPVDKDATGGRKSSQPSTVKSSTKVENKEKSTSQPKLKGKTKRQLRRSDRFSEKLGRGKAKPTEQQKKKVIDTAIKASNILKSI